MAKLAFLTEVNNGEACLRSAADSILRQTETDFVYFIADDGSTDGTRAIIADYAADRRVIPLYYSRNDRTGNFNRALAAVYASGADYFALLDADDRYEPDFAATLLEQLERTGADLAEARFTAHFEDDPDASETPPGYGGDLLLTRREFADGFAYLNFFHALQQWWGKIYRISILKRLELFADGSWDTGFVQRYRTACEKFVLCDRVLHHYLVRADSDCHRTLRRFNGRGAAAALSSLRAERTEFLRRAGCVNPQSWLMADYLSVADAKYSLTRLAGAALPDPMKAREALYLLRLPFLARDYESVRRAFAFDHALFGCPPPVAEAALAEIRACYGDLLRLCVRWRSAGNQAFLFGWFCRVSPWLADFFEPRDLPALAGEGGAAVLDGRLGDAYALLADVPANGGGAALLKAYVCCGLGVDRAFRAAFYAAHADRLSEKQAARIKSAP